MSNEGYIDLWCPLYGHVVRLAHLQKHRDRKHKNVAIVDLKELIRKKMEEGTLRYRNRMLESVPAIKETLIYSRVCARDRFWSSGKARCRFGS